MAIDNEGPSAGELSGVEGSADGGTNTGLDDNWTASTEPNEAVETETFDPVEEVDEEVTEPAEIEYVPAPPRHFWRMPTSFRYYLNLETALYGLIVIFAIFSRFYNLSAQTLHHDEGVHAYYSWLYYDGQGYSQEPWKHGPFLYHITALMFWLFGDNNETVRLSTALFGVLTCLLPIGLRKELGRWGALTASFLLLISPMFLYYSRFLREDIFVSFAVFSLFISLVRFLKQPRAAWWNAAMVSLGMLFCTKEVSFFYLALFGGFLGVWLCWQLAPRLILILGGYGLLALIVFFAVIALYPPPPIPFDSITGDQIGQYVGQLVVHPIFITFWIVAIVGLGVAWFAFAEVASARRQFMVDQGWAKPSLKARSALFAPYQTPGTVAYAVGWLGRNWKSTLIGLACLAAFYFVFFTGFFSDIPQGSVGLLSGLWYWMAQQGVARGSQPWFYYLFMMPLYEPLALMFGTFAGVLIIYRSVRYGFQRQHRKVLVPVTEAIPTVEPAGIIEEEDELDELGDPTPAPAKPVAPRAQATEAQKLTEVEVTLRPAGNALWPGRRRREVHPYLVPLFLTVWGFGSLLFYTWASEKMPWLTVELTLPFILLAAWLMDHVWSGIEDYFASGASQQVLLWGIRGKTFFWIHVGGLIFTGFLAYVVILMLTSAEEKISADYGHYNWILVWVPPAIAVLFFTGIFSFIGFKMTVKTSIAVVFGLMTIYLLHTGIPYAFDHGDVALEPGIYTQTTPDVYRVVQEIDTVTSVLPALKQTPILYDQDLATPLDFYLRHYDYKKDISDFSTMTQQAGSALSLNDYEIIMVSDSKASTLTADQKQQLDKNFENYKYTFQYWFEESQYRNFDQASSVETSFLLNKTAATQIKDVNNNVVLNTGETLTQDKLQQLDGLVGVLDKVYNANGGNSTLLHLKDAGESLYQLHTPGDFSRLWRYVIYREQFQPLGRREFTLYVKKDIAPMWRKYSDLVPQPISGSGK